MHCKAKGCIYNKDGYCMLDSIIILTLGLCKEILYNSTPERIINRYSGSQETFFSIMQSNF